ncbi:MAG: DUF4387 domain-containing protein [Fibrobacteres bacterium]|nr:DUF4387 domain-containing protein [Fibrobacterota bacterium]
MILVIKKITDYASVIRSKNSGPYELTLDIMFKDKTSYELWKKRNALTAGRIAALYGVAKSTVLKTVWFEPANAFKCTIKRPIPSGNFGEHDIYGAQQHAPLLNLTL